VDCTRHAKSWDYPKSRRGILSARQLISLVVLLLLMLAPQTCRAQFTARDGQIIARTLGFIESAASGVVEIGIVYAPDSRTSQRQAEDLRATIGDALTAGKVILKARLIPVDQLPTVTGIAGIYVTDDLGPHLDDVVAAARRLHVPTISTEMACVQAGRCVLAFSSQPTVEIVLNRGAANNAGVRFNQAFRMLVREL
jgi:hypothetical protein